MSQRLTVTGLLLAAGASRRLGHPKQLLETADGVPLVRSMVQRLLDAGCSRVLVVLGANAESVRLALAPYVDVSDSRAAVECIEHLGWADGMGTSIAAGVSALDAGEAPDAVLIAACDMPSVTTAHLRTLIDSSSTNSGHRRSASVYGAAHGEEIAGIPAVFPYADFPALRQLSGDRGARSLLRDALRNADIPLIALAEGDLDLDTPDDVRRWRSS